MVLKNIIAVVCIFYCVASGMAQYTEPTPIMKKGEVKSFIKAHIDYPVSELENKNQGTVIIEFSTNKFGDVTNTTVVQPVSHALDSAALSIFKLILWKPATSYGKNVDGKSEFKIKYNIKNFTKITKRRGYKHIGKPTFATDTTLTIYNKKSIDTIPEPILPKGINNVSNFIYNNLVYPDVALKLALSGEVKLSFIIEADGLPSNITAQKTLGGGCTEEAIRIIELIKWKPGVYKNQAVRTSYNISIFFKKNDGGGTHIPNQQGSGI